MTDLTWIAIAAIAGILIAYAISEISACIRQQGRPPSK